MRAMLSEPHPSHCHLIPTAVTVCTQVCVTAHMQLCVCMCQIQNAEGYQKCKYCSNRSPVCSLLELFVALCVCADIEHSTLTQHMVFTIRRWFNVNRLSVNSSSDIHSVRQKAVT